MSLPVRPGRDGFIGFARTGYTSPVRSVPLLAAGMVIALLTVSCRDLGSDQEREDGLAFRKVLRERECDSSEVDRREFTYVERVKLYLRPLGVSAQTPTETKSSKARVTPTVELIDRALAPLAEYVKLRVGIKNALNSVTLHTPLPIAMRDDLLEALDERITVDDDWSVRLQVLRTAITLHDEALIENEIKRCDELFEAYAPPKNILRLAADDIEEQLRLPWYSAPKASKEQPCGQSPIPAPSPEGPV